MVEQKGRRRTRGKRPVQEVPLQEPSIADNLKDESTPRWYDAEHRAGWVRLFRSDAFHNIVTTVAVVVAVGSLIFTNRNQEKALKVQQEIQQSQIDFLAEEAANDAWVIYREVEGNFRTVGHTNIAQMTDNEKYLYHLTVERLMMAADIVTYSLGKDKQWSGAFAIEFYKYKSFILNDLFLKEYNGNISEFCTYRDAVHLWIESAFQNEPQALRQIKNAHDICKAHLLKLEYSDELGRPI